MNFYKHPLFHLFCPARCACCGKVIHQDQPLCSACEPNLFPIDEGICPACGCPKNKCICRKRPRTQVSCVSPYFYEGAVQQGVLTLKRGRSIHGAYYFAGKMADLVRRRYGYHFDGVVYVPMCCETREYNQSRQLAKALAELLDLPLLDNALIKVYDTPKQHHSQMRRRKGNVFGAFEADPQVVAHKHLLLVDDIVTTGATLDECAKMLLLANCEEVCGVTVASTRFKLKGEC